MTRTKSETSLTAAEILSGMTREQAFEPSSILHCIPFKSIKKRSIEYHKTSPKVGPKANESRSRG